MVDDLSLKRDCVMGGSFSSPGPSDDTSLEGAQEEIKMTKANSVGIFFMLKEVWPVKYKNRQAIQNGE
jgi:hypothetical protein